jgi:MATE family, multidrug efflux pump
LFFVFFSEPVIRLFTNEPAVVALGTICLRILSYGNVFYAFAMVILQSFNGAGDTLTPTVLHFFGYWMLQIPLAYWLAIHTALQARGVFFAVLIADGAIAVAGIVLFRRGRWKNQQI